MLEKAYELFKQPSIFLFQWRSFSCVRLVQYVLMFGGVPIFAYGVRPYDSQLLSIIVFTVLALYSGFFATLLWNDITDIDIDTLVHPNRPLPAGRISVRKMFAVALVFSALTFIFSFLISFWCFILVGSAALFVAFHNKYLKKIVKFPAYSEIFTPVQWLIVPIFGFLAIWSALPSSGEEFSIVSIFGHISFDWYAFHNMILLVLFTYFADNAHDLSEGIHDVDGDRKLGVRTYATSFGEKTAARISFAMLFISGILGIILFFRTILTPIFLAPFLLLWLYALYHSFMFVRSDEKEMKMLGKKVGEKTFRYFWITYDLIFIDVLIQIFR